MKGFRIHLRYIYTFYSFNELLDCEPIDETVEILDTPHRFTLHLQEDASFIVSEVKEDYKGKFTVITFPNKDNLIVHEGEEVELAYDEYFDAMGDDNHNVYEGTIALERI